MTVCGRCGSDDIGTRANGRRRCKECYRVKAREWAAANRKRAAEKTRLWRKNNPEKAAANNKRWCKNNQERLAETKAAWRARNPDKVRAFRAKRTHLEENAAGGPFVVERYVGRVALYFGMCAYCEISRATELDHGIPLSRGGSNWPANVYPACRPCNASKYSKKLHSEWVQPKTR